MNIRMVQKSMLVRHVIIISVITTACWNIGNSQEPGRPDKFEMVRAHIQSWLSGIDVDSLIVSPAFLKDSLVNRWSDKQGSNQIISVRNPDDFNKAGHIPNAINIYWPEIVADENLARLDSGKTLIFYCYYGHASMICCTILDLLGYKGLSLNFGMMDWNIGALVKAPWDQVANYETESTIHDPHEIFPLPIIKSNLADVRSIIVERARHYFGGEGSPVISTADVKVIVENWGERKSKCQIVDVRSKIDYEKGHVPNSFNIPCNRIAEIENLKRLDPGRTVIVYSENGQTGEIAATVLNLLGYHALDMKFGMMDWNKSRVDNAKLWHGAADYPVEI
jgi:rhodanese-related sulfurtransferase